MRSAFSFFVLVSALVCAAQAQASGSLHGGSQVASQGSHMTMQEKESPTLACVGLYRYKEGTTNHYVEFDKDGKCTMDFGGEKVTKETCTFKQEKYQVTVTNKQARVVWNFTNECAELDIGGGRILKLEKSK